ncbi:MAG: 6-phosphogluconolactonase [Thiomonas sp.]
MLHVCANPQDQTAQLVCAIQTALAQDIAQQGRALLAVSGGRSPVPLFHALAQASIDWPRVAVTLVDERVVPPDHADSNAALVRAHLLTGAAAQARFLPLVDDPQDLAGCVARANAHFRELAQPISVALLGMGEDGHTASLFPSAAELAAGLDPAYPEPYLSIRPTHAPHARISLSLAALLQSHRLLLSIAGQAKHAVYAQAATPPPCVALPISFLVQQTRTPFDAYWTP